MVKTLIWPTDGATYEDKYGKQLEIFRTVAEAENGTYQVCGVVPACARDLLFYLGEGLDRSWTPMLVLRREELEAKCAYLPVTVDALWRADMKWSGARRHTYETKFNIATYSGFWRPEILDFMDKVARYRTQYSKCVIVPCAADKPYPAPLHQKVREVVGPEYEMIVVSSAVGLAPEPLWALMPNYDAGLPFFERVADVAAEYFAVNDYDEIIVYTDMVGDDLMRGIYQAKDEDLSGVIDVIGQNFYDAELKRPVKWHNVPMTHRPDYLPLHEERYLKLLRDAVAQ